LGVADELRIFSEFSLDLSSPQPMNAVLYCLITTVVVFFAFLKGKVQAFQACNMGFIIGDFQNCPAVIRSVVP